MSGPVDVETADVYKGEKRAGVLRREGDDVVFTYDEEYAESEYPAVATTLSKTQLEYRERGGAVPPYFAGLLPEGRRLTAIQDALKTSPDDEFSQVVAVGADCTGDVRILATGSPITEPLAARVRGLPDPTTIYFRKLFADVLQRPLDSPAIAGVQDKISAQMISLPVTGSYGPAIIKLAPAAFPHLIRNEAFFLDVARACGLEVPRFQVIRDAAGEEALVVNRFDRVIAGGRLISIPQEDAVQLAGRWPASKYRMSARDVFAAVANVATAPVVEIAKLIRLFSMSYVIGNGDLHAKNVSVQYVNGFWRVTPAYDIVSTIPYGDRDMALDTEGRKDNLKTRDFVALAARHGISEAATLRILTDVASACADLIEHVADIGLDERAASDLMRVGRKRARDISS